MIPILEDAIRKARQSIEVRKVEKYSDKDFYNYLINEGVSQETINILAFQEIKKIAELIELTDPLMHGAGIKLGQILRLKNTVKKHSEAKVNGSAQVYGCW